MPPIGVIFGAGNIGKGLVAELFQDAGLMPVFIEAVPDVVARLSAKPDYMLHLHGSTGSTVRKIGPFAVCKAGSAEAAHALRSAHVCATAVGPPNLPSVGRALASACEERTAGQWNVLVCENDCYGAERLRHVLTAQGDRAPGCVQCSVERMVAGSETDEQGKIHVHAESYRPLFAERTGWKGPLAKWHGLQFVDDIGALFDRKKYTNNFGHAVLGYLGAAKGYRFVWEAAEDEGLSCFLADLLERIGSALAEDYGVWSPEELRNHVRTLVGDRYLNRQLGDTLERVCRDPARKLGPDERIMGALRLLERYGLSTAGFGRLIGAATLFALQHEQENWPGSQLSRSELHWAVADLTGLDEASPIIGEALDFLILNGGLK